LKVKLTQLEQDHQKWRRRSAQQVNDLEDGTLTQEASEMHTATVANNRSEQLKIFTQAVACRKEGRL